MLEIGSSDRDFLSRMKLYEWYDENAVKKTKILLAGAGALGNEVAKNLVLSGYEKMLIVDMDKIVHSNLSRCVFFRKEDAVRGRYKAEVLASRIEELNENAEVEGWVGNVEDIDENDIRNYDIVVGCLDNVKARLHINAISYAMRIPYIDGATHGVTGKVQVIVPPVTSCMQCGMNITHSKMIAKRFSCTERNVKYFQPNIPSDINTTSIIAGIEVQEVLKITHGMDNYIKNIFYYDGKKNFFSIFKLPINPNCPNHNL